MALRFAETMAGTLDGATGVPLPVAFHVSATGEGQGYFRLGGSLVVGDARVPCEGVLVIRPRSLRYRVRGADGSLVAGQKTLSLRRPLASMTTLPVELRRADGTEVGRGKLLFNLRDLPAFLLSFRPR